MAILNDVLDHSKIEAGKLQLAQAPLALHGVATASANLFRANALAKGLELAITIGHGVPDMVLGDAQRLKQVLLNLLGNAIKFTEQGRIELRLVARRLGPSTATVRFEVRDTGIGMDADAAARIFQPFQQVVSRREHRRGGTGLGLTISQRIIEAMGGHIEVASTPGRGSCFSFELAFALDSHSTAAAVTDSALGGLDEISRLAGTVLVVEDNEVNRMIAVEMLRRLGVQVREAHDGEQAVRAIAAQPVDAVLMDCQMPVMDGYTATRRIRAMERSSGRGRVPIIALTAEAFDYDLARAHDVGMDAHLSKPYTMEDLREMLSNWM
jgi:CheY-like chemotaxis protein